MTRALWFIAEVLAGVALSGVTTAVLVPVVTESGRQPDARLVWASLAVTILACVAIGERLRARRQRRPVS